MVEPAFISIGSNITPARYLPRAVELLGALGDLAAVSMVYQNPAIGPRSAPDFLNAAALVFTPAEATKIRGDLRRIEQRLDRHRQVDRYAPRTIDLDLCLLGGLVRDSAPPVLPDPEIPRRAHVCVCLAELAPNFPHPLTGTRLEALAAGHPGRDRLIPRPDLRCDSWPRGPVDVG